MCGIVGVFAARPLLEYDDATCAAAIDALSHRGPDDRGLYWSADRTALLGHRRLSIIDLAGGQQPLADEGARRRLIYNGEIYNFPALRAELAARGHVLRTQSDGEPVLHLYEEDPAGFLERLAGMFALAVLDEDARSLTLARDRLGIKPLYFTVADQRLLFASELKALRPLLGGWPELCPAALCDYLRWKYIPAPATIYRGVHELPAGCRLDARLDAAGRGLVWRVRRYWSPDYGGPRIRDEAAAVEELDHLLRGAIDRHLEADVEVGALLSGGVDSSLVVALADRLGRRRIRTFAVGFEEPGFDQLPFARRLAEHVGTEHHEELVALDPLAALPRLVRAFDQPFADSSALASDLVCRAAARHVKVVLTGDGGDEAFAGYQRYQPLLPENARKQPIPWRWLRQAGFVLGVAVLSPEARPLQKLRYADCTPLERFARLEWTATDYLLGRLLPPDWRPQSAAPAAETPLLTSADRADSSGFEPDALPAGMHPGYVALDRAAERHGWPDLSLAQYADLMCYLPGDILTKVDRTSMAWSLECRPPLLDHTIIEFSTRLAPELLIRGGVGKYLLKRVAERYVPRELLYRKKRGFRVPLRRWFKGALLGETATRLTGGELVRGGLLEPDGLRWLLAAQQRPGMNFASLLWAMMFLEEWLRVRG